MTITFMATLALVAIFMRPAFSKCMVPILALAEDDTLMQACPMCCSAYILWALYASVGIMISVAKPKLPALPHHACLRVINTEHAVLRCKLMSVFKNKVNTSHAHQGIRCGPPHVNIMASCCCTVSLVSGCKLCLPV